MIPAPDLRVKSSSSSNSGVQTSRYPHRATLSRRHASTERLLSISSGRKSLVPLGLWSIFSCHLRRPSVISHEMPLHPVFLFSLLIFPLGRFPQEPVEGGLPALEDLLPLFPALEVEGEEDEPETDHLVEDEAHVHGDEGEGRVGNPVAGRRPVAGKAGPEKNPHVPEPEEIGGEGAESGDKGEVTHANTN